MTTTKPTPQHPLKHLLTIPCLVAFAIQITAAKIPTGLVLPTKNISYKKLLEAHSQDKRSLEVLHTLVTLCKSNPDLYTRVKNVSDLVDAQKVTLVTIPVLDAVDDPLKKTLRLYFKKDGEDGSPGAPFIVIAETFFQLLKTHRSLALSLFIREITATSFYVEHPEMYKNALQIPLELYLYAMDEDYIQAKFIELYKDKHKELLTQYEKCLLESLVKDDLQTESLILRGTDMKLVYRLQHLAENGTPFEDAVDEFIRVGKNLDSQFKISPKANSLEAYTAVASLCTFLQYGPQLVADIYLKKGPNIAAFTIADHPELMEIFANIQKKISENGKFLNYQSHFIKNLDNEL